MDNTNQTFEEKKLEYLEDLGSKLLLTSKIGQQEGMSDIVKIMTNPKDELELQYSIAYIRFYEDMFDDLQMISESENKDLEGNMFIDFARKYLKAIQNNASKEELQKILDSYNFDDNESLAKMYHDTMVALTIPETYEIIIKDCNIDINDPESVMKLTQTLETAKNDLNYNIIVMDSSLEGMVKFIEFADVYHGFIQDQKNKNSQLQ